MYFKKMNDGSSYYMNRLWNISDITGNILFLFQSCVPDARIDVNSILSEPGCYLSCVPDARIDVNSILSEPGCYFYCRYIKHGEEFTYLYI